MRFQGFVYLKGSEWVAIKKSRSVSLVRGGGEVMEHVDLGGLRKTLADGSTLDLLEELAEVGLKLLAFLHAPVGAEILGEQSSPLAVDLQSQVLLRLLDRVAGVGGHDLLETREDLTAAVAALLRPRGHSHSEQKMQDFFGKVVGFVKNAPHFLGEGHRGVVAGVGLRHRDVDL